MGKKAKKEEVQNEATTPKHKIKVPKGAGKLKGKKQLSIKRHGPKRMSVDALADTGGGNNIQVRLTYDFEFTELLDAIEQEFTDQVHTLVADGDLTSDEVLDFLEAAFQKMSEGIANVRGQIEEVDV